MQLIKITRMLGLLVFVCLPALADFDEAGEEGRRGAAVQKWGSGSNEHLKSYQEWNGFNREFERFFAAKKYYEAFVVAYKSLNIAREHASPNHPATILSQSNLAQAESVGDRELFKSVPAKHPTLFTYGIIGVIPVRFPVSMKDWSRCGGQFRSFCSDGHDGSDRRDKLPALDTAVRRYQETLAIQEKWLGPNHPSLVRNLQGLGNTYQNLKQNTLAKRSYQRALAILTRQGANLKKMSDLLEDLAYLCRLEGDIKQSVLYFEKSLVQKIKLLGTSHADLVGPLRNLSGLYVVLNRDAEAEKLERHAARIEAVRR